MTLRGAPRLVYSIDESEAKKITDEDMHISSPPWEVALSMENKPTSSVRSSESERDTFEHFSIVNIGHQLGDPGLVYGSATNDPN
nr:hypothetical protein CFP56_41503 [Quercus suber]